jgi:hypothetical protein
MACSTPDRTQSVFPLTAQGAGTVNGADLDGGAGTGLIVFIDVTAITGTSPTLTVNIQGKDKISGKYYNILSSAAITTVSTVVLRVFPSLATVANVSANDVLPPDFRIQAVIGGTSPAVTCSISCAVLE